MLRFVKRFLRELQKTAPGAVALLIMVGRGFGARSKPRPDHRGAVGAKEGVSPSQTAPHGSGRGGARSSLAHPGEVPRPAPGGSLEPRGAVPEGAVVLHIRPWPIAWMEVRLAMALDATDNLLPRLRARHARYREDI